MNPMAKFQLLSHVCECCGRRLALLTFEDGTQVIGVVNTDAEPATREPARRRLEDYDS